MRDPASGWTLHVITENFTFSPQNASRDHVPGEGHAHVYINGVKLGRFYGPWVHLDNLPEGEVTVEVTLNANDHRPLAVSGVPLAEIVRIVNYSAGTRPTRQKRSRPQGRASSIHPRGAFK